MAKNEAENHWPRIREMLDAALALPASQRPEWVDEACSDPEVARQVRSILAVYESETQADRKFSGLVQEKPSLAVGQVIGPWRLESHIGEGGMGTVFLAARSDETFAKKVALKILRGAWAGDAAKQRFRVERQILADLEHPGIAKLLDGGNTKDGHPYLVMEYVEGIPLDAYCEKNLLGLEARIELFLEVCAAVQFAHQNLIVHRDLKPGNVLVDGAGRSRLLDFGIAKILKPQEFAEPVYATHPGAMPMTPAYASPEQIRAGAITTASDVYSLGMILFRLLTGALPYTITQSNLENWVQVICHAEAPLPSARLEADTREDAASRLRRGWLGRLRGDLDAIVLKALAKAPESRYATAEQLADDLRRYLSGEPVQARRDSWHYRGRKFAKRHRWVLLAAAAVFLAMVGAIVALLAQRDALIAERNRARTVIAWMTELFRLPDPSRSLGAKVTAFELLEKSRRTIDQDLDDQPEVLATMLEVLGETYLNLGQTPQAIDCFRRALQLVGRFELADDRSAELNEKLARGENLLGNWRRAAPLAEEAWRLAHRRGTPRRDPLWARIARARAVVAISRGEMHQADRLLAEAVGLARESGDQEVLADVLSRHAAQLGELSRIDEALAKLEEAIAIDRRLHGLLHPRVAVNQGLEASLTFERDPASAERTMREVLATQRKLFDGRHLAVAITLNDLALILERQGKLEEAAPYYREAIAMGEELVGRSAATMKMNYANLLAKRGELAEAERQYRQALEDIRQDFGENHSAYGLAEANFSDLVFDQGRVEEAKQMLDHGMRVIIDQKGPNSRHLVTILTNRAGILRHEGQIAEARALVEKAVEISRANQGYELGDTLQHLCYFLTAAEQHEDAVRCLEEVLTLPSSDPLSAIRARTRMAKSLLALGRLPEAAEQAGLALEVWNRNPDAEPLWTLSAEQSLGLSLLRQGRLTEAAPILQKRLARARALSPADAASVAKADQDLEELRAARRGAATG